jgi:hypothetical protein
MQVNNSTPGAPACSVEFPRPKAKQMRVAHSRPCRRCKAHGAELVSGVVAGLRKRANGFEIGQETYRFND